MTLDGRECFEHTMDGANFGSYLQNPFVPQEEL